MAPSTVPPPPRALQVEITAACNLRCEMCLVRYRPPVDRISGTMPFDRFRRLVDELPGLESLTLQGLGEPLLVPHLVDMVAYAAARGIAVGFNTNGTLLTADKAERLVEAGLAWMHISVDGATAATYESIRGGSRFERVRRGVTAMVDARRRLAFDHPELQLVFVAMRRNHRELPGLVRLAWEWGVERVRVQNLAHSFSDTDGCADQTGSDRAATSGYEAIRAYTEAEALWLGPEPEAEASFADARRAAAALGVDLRLPRLPAPAPARPRPPGVPGCDWPWESSYVGHDGTIQPCCMIMGQRAVLGRLSDASFTEVWAGAPYRDFRHRLLGDDPPEVCRGCALYRGTF